MRWGRHGAAQRAVTDSVSNESIDDSWASSRRRPSLHEPHRPAALSTAMLAYAGSAHAGCYTPRMTRTASAAGAQVITLFQVTSHPSRTSTRPPRSPSPLAARVLNHRVVT